MDTADIGMWIAAISVFWILFGNFNTWMAGWLPKAVIELKKLVAALERIAAVMEHEEERRVAREKRRNASSRGAL